MTEQECKDSKGNWVEKDGTWMCEHPEQSDDSTAKPAEEGAEEEAM